MSRRDRHTARDNDTRQLFDTVWAQLPTIRQAINDTAPSVYGTSTQFAAEPEGRRHNPIVHPCDACGGRGTVWGTMNVHTASVERHLACPHCGGAGVIPDTGTNTTTETAALSPAREHARHQARRLEQAITAINLELGKILSIGAKVTPGTAPELCNRGIGREGQVEWSDPLCQNLPATDRGGMCDACAKREYRWRKAHDLPPRERGAAA